MEIVKWEYFEGLSKSLLCVNSGKFCRLWSVIVEYSHDFEEEVLTLPVYPSFI